MPPHGIAYISCPNHMDKVHYAKFLHFLGHQTHQAMNIAVAHLLDDLPSL